ncbi:sirohydrochlorin cobaltochelatase [Lachnospiraceae bacterium 50-23]|jgi:sirohydrochlorin cobaltochelatase|nr:sirohydrochlorin cobaltochelatase [Dorea sp.]GFI36248.1 sirohydrochlorin cobaltochelatase [Lachnospiraceae bacterium]
MNQKNKTGILTVSFGTCHQKTRAATIDAIEAQIAGDYPQAHVYRAWTSHIIRKKLAQVTGEQIPSVTEAIEHILRDGVTHLFIQPTHVINGIENDRMKEDVFKYREHFHCISFGSPLISSTEDMRHVVRTLGDAFCMEPDEALLLMGHGSEHPSNTVYAALDYMFKEMGYPRVYVGTVEAYPSLPVILRQLAGQKISRLHLAPLMIVAGDHAANDMAGDEEDSWANICKKAGYEVTCHLKGLGEYPQIQQLFSQHIEQSITDAGGNITPAFSSLRHNV